MTTARITSLSPQVYASTLRAAQEAKSEAGAAKHVSGVQTDPAVSRGGSAKMPGIGQVVDVLA